MSNDPDQATWERARGLDERVLSTLQRLPGRIAFNGLRRVLNAHPESLSRSLRRLEREGQVDRSAGGYRAIGGVTTPVQSTRQVLRAIAQVELPAGTRSEMVLGRLAGRWFGSLRWVGVVEGRSGSRLAWARRDGSGHVLLEVHRGVLRVYLRGDRLQYDGEEAEDAAYELLTHAVGALRLTPGRSSGPAVFYTAELGPRSFVLDN